MLGKKDLTAGTVTAWLLGFGDLPEKLTRFALTLPHWEEGSLAPESRSFAELRSEMAQREELRPAAPSGGPPPV